MAVLVTGGAGYIGSHICVELLHRNYDVVVLDNLSNSHAVVIDRIESVSGVRPVFIKGDIGDCQLVANILADYQITSVIHMAGLKAVGESVTDSLRYYANNVAATVSFLNTLSYCQVKKILFSSSATVYGEPKFLPYTEQHPLSAINPYGRTKLFVEEILRDLVVSDSNWSVGILRYFNPIGAHPSGLIGEDPHGIPNNLMPYITQVAIGKLSHLNVWGGDYPTKDGTGVRDYIHVVDLAIAHINTLESMRTGDCLTLNIGTGTGYSVLDVIRAFESANKVSIPYEVMARRDGDLPEYYASPRSALETINWKAERSLIDMCRDTWNWQQKNPDGYQKN